MSTSLFELTTEMLEIEQILSNFDGDVTDDEKEQAIDLLFARWQENGEELKVKIDNYLWLVAELDGRAEIRAAESKRLAELAAADRKNGERLQQRLYQFLKAIDRRKFESNYHKLSIVGNGGKRPITYTFDDLDQVAKEYVVEKVVRELDREKIREELEAGAELPFARLEERGERLKIS